MKEIERLLRKEVARLLSENLIDVFVGFEEESAPLRPQPTFITNAADADRLIYTGFCQNNLANYITHLPRDKRIGIMVRGCDSRAAHALVVENQHDREKLFLLGVPCRGILDIKKIHKITGSEVLSAEEKEETVVVNTPNGIQTLIRQEMIHDSCLRCLHPNPVTPDVMLGELLPEGDPFLARQPIQDFENLTAAERYTFFTHEAERCIRCYACREACPMCYCTECFVDHAVPRWNESTVSPAGTHAWHIVRAFHQTGRCVSCGACERACPMDIKMTYLTDKLNDDMRKLYDFEVGLDETNQPPFAAFTLDDKDRFVG